MFKAFWLTLSPWKKVKLILILILFIYILAFSFLNWKSQVIDFIFFDLNFPITVLIAICLLAGYLSASLFDYNKYKMKESEINALKEKIEILEQKKIKHG